MFTSIGIKRTSIAVAILLVMTACFFAGRHFTPKSSQAPDNAKHILYYVDPMHPTYKSANPGIAPDCGMALVPVYDSSPTDSAPAGSIYISSDRLHLAGIRGEAATMANAATRLRVTGKVVADDTRIYRINAGASGWIRNTYDGAIGSFVKKDQRLASYYSPDFISLEQGFLVATERIQAGVKMRDNAPGSTATTLRLKNLGMSDAQIEELAKSRQMPDLIDIVSPADGVIVSRTLNDGMKFEVGAEFYRIADLGHVWIEAQIVQDEAEDFKPGTLASIRIPGQSRTLQARVSDTLPQFEPTSRTMKLRLEAENPGFVLRPDMLVDVDLATHAKPGLSVPVDAIIDQGTQQMVFLDLGNGYFEPRTVQTGWRSNGRVEIKQGLEPGQIVVVDGAFLLDSETRLKQGTATTPETKVSMPMNGMSGMKSSDMPNSMPMSMKEGTTQTKDPECGMSVDPKQSIAQGNTLVSSGNTLYFCSKSCKDKYSKKHPAPAMPMSSAGGQQ